MHTVNNKTTRDYGENRTLSLPLSETHTRTHTQMDTESRYSQSEIKYSCKAIDTHGTFPTSSFRSTPANYFPLKLETTQSHNGTTRMHNDEIQPNADTPYADTLFFLYEIGSTEYKF